MYIFPGPTYRPDLPNFFHRFEMLSENSSGVIFSWTTNAKFKDYKIGDFNFLASLNPGKGLKGKLKLAFFVLSKGFSLKNIDVIVCYDPVFTGVLGVLLKWRLKSRLIVELNNSNLAKALEMEEGATAAIRLKAFMYKLLRSFTLKFADGIKLLTENQRIDLEPRYERKKIYCFNDYVPTHFFQEKAATFGNYILCVGFPFHRKGVDILVKAFEKIADRYPDFTLRFVGHELQEEAKKRLGIWHERIEFLKPVFYDELRDHFLNCYCFVLPSREEGMGCVLLEAMSCGKPVIGSRVGGIPGIIRDERNGFLFESENVDSLSEKLERFLSSDKLTQKMGKESLDVISESFSSKKYCEYFKNMIDGVSIKEFKC
ncbi:MAG: glycosyltransferase family 4 protein [Candidatus Omnitrophica bacterium]|nr:glycosyltransferase family 4 protein [Candidatus Omnitrophota bacterium]